MAGPSNPASQSQSAAIVTSAQFDALTRPLGALFERALLEAQQVPRSSSLELDLVGYAAHLGIDMAATAGQGGGQAEPHLHWVAERYALAPLPAGWAEFSNEDGAPYFHHAARNETLWDQCVTHPGPVLTVALESDACSSCCEDGAGPGLAPARH